MDNISGQSTRIERVKKPAKCPACGHAPMTSIIYGEPVFSGKLMQELEEGKTALGGCWLGWDHAAWKCIRCGQRIHRK